MQILVKTEKPKDMTNRKLFPPKYRFEKLMISLFFIFISATNLFAQNPTISIIPSDTTICADQTTFYINFAVVTDDSTVLWTTTGTGTFTTPNNDTTYYQPSAADKTDGLVTLRLYAYPKSTSTDTVNSFLILRFSDPPIITYRNDTIVCSSYELPTIQGSNISANAAYFTLPNRAGDRYDALDIITTSGRLYINDSTATCSDEVFFQVTIDTPPIVNAGNDTSFCAGQNFILAIGHASDSNNDGISWSENGTGSITAGINSLTPTYTHGVGETGIITLTLTANGKGSCPDVSDFLRLTINSKPIITTPDPITRCSSYELPPIQGSNISANAAYFTLPNRAGDRYDALDIITTSGRLYINDSTATCSDEVFFQVIIDTPPIVNAGNDTSICSGQNFIVPGGRASVSNYGTYLWTENGNGSITSGAATLTPTYTPGVGETGTITLTLTATAIGSCSNISDDFVLTINPKPAILPLTDPQRSCSSYELPNIQGSNISVNAAYFTAPNGGGIEYAPFDSIFASDLIYIYDNNGSCSDQQNFNVIIDNPPIVNAGVDQTICSDGTALLLATANFYDNATIIWSGINGGTFSNTSVLNPTFIPSATQITNGYADLTITVNGSGACSGTTVSDMVRVNLTTPTVNAGGDVPVCSNGTVQLNAIATYYDNTTVSWTAVGGGTFSSTSILNPTFTPSASQISNGYADLTVSVNGLGVCSGRVVSDIIRVVITAIPTVDAGAAPTICSNGTASLLAIANSYDNASISWSAAGGGTFSSTSVLNPTFSPSANQINNGYADLTITVNGLGTCSGTSVSDGVRVFITSPIVNAGVDQTICSDGTASLIATASSYDNSTIIWSGINGGTFSNPSALISTFTPSATQISNGYADLTITVNGSGACSSTTVFDVVRVNLTTPTINAGGDVTVCSNGTAQLNATATHQDNTSIIWTAVGGGTFSSTASLNPTFTPSASQITNGYADLTVSVNGLGVCAGRVVSDIVRVVITDAPTVNAGAAPTICSNGTASLTAIANNQDNSTINWTAVGGGTFSTTSSLTTTFTPSASQITNGYADLTVSVNGLGACSGSLVSDIVRVIITNPTVDAGPDGNICGVNTHTLNGSGTNYDASTIVWTIITGNGSLSATNILNPVYTPTTQDYDNPVRLSMRVNGIGACSGTTYTDEVFLYYSEHVVVDAGPATAIICENSTYTTSASTNAPSTYQWSRNVDGDGTFDDDQLLNPTYTPGPADIAKGTVTLTLEATGAGTCLGNSIDQIVLQIKSLPTANAGPASVTICENSTYTTSDATALNYDNLIWTIIEGGGSISNSNSLTEAQYIPGQVAINQGYAILRLRVTSLSPCFISAIDEIRINLTPEPEITVGTIPTLCVGVPYQVTIVDTAYSSAVAWTLISGTGPFTGGNTISPTYTPTATDAVNGSITLRLVASATSPCTGSTTQDIVFQVAAAPTVELGANITVCEGTSSIALNPTVTNGVSFLWTKTGGDGINSFSNRLIRNPTYNPSAADYAAGTVRLTLVVTGTSLCSSTVSDYLDVIFTAAPTAFVKSADSICVGSSYYISTAVATNYSSIVWSHDGNGTLAGANLEKPTYTSVALDAGRNVTLTMRVNGNGTCSYVEDQIVLSVLRGPTVNTGSDVSVCGTSYQISGVTANYQDGLQWTTSGNGTFNNPTILNPIYTFGSNEIASGIVSLTLTASAVSPCAVDASDSFIIHLVDGPIAYAGPDISICQTQNYVTSSATASNSTSVLWEIVSGSGTIANANNLVTTYTPSANDIDLGSVTLKLTAYGNVSCPSHSDLITITINKQATAVAGGPASVCLGTTYSVTGASVLNASSFSWTSNGYGSLTNPTTLTPSYTPHINDITLGGGVVNLTLTATSAAPCAGNAVSVKVLTIINQPTAFAGSAAFTCPGSDYEIQSATATYASDYVWTSSSGGVFSNNHTIRPTYHVNSTDAAQGWVDITLSATPISPCFTAATHTFRLTVLEGPTAYAGAPQTICADVDYINTDATATDYTSLRWETSGTGTFSNDTLLHPTYSFGLADSINGYVTLTLHAYGSGSNGCNHDQSSVNITINKLPTANAGSMTEICVGSNPIIGASASNNSGVLWTRISGTGTLLVANSLQPIYNTSPGDIGTTVVLQLAALPLAPCTDTAYSTLSLFVRATPIVNAGPNDTICGIVPIVLSGATESNTTTRVWSSSGTGSFTDSTILNPSYTPSANDVSTGAVTLTITGYNGSCGGVSDYMILYISSPPQVSAGQDSSVCVNSTYTANGVITGSYTGILWSKTGAGTLLNTNSRTPTFIPDPGQVGQTITLTMKVASSAPCIDSVSSSVNLLVKAVPTALAGNDTTICENGTYKIIGAGATNAPNIFWTTSGDGIFTGGPPLSPTYIPGPNDIINGFAILTINSANPPCLNVIDQMRLTFSYLPVVNAGNNATVDIGTSFTVSTATVSDSSPINWTSTGTGTFTGGTTLTPTYTPSATDFANGSVRLTLTATPSGICTTPVSDYMVLTVTDHPAVDFSWASSCAGTLTDFVIDTIVTDIPAIPYYRWDFGDGNTSLTREPSHLFATAGIYRVTLTVTDTAGYTNIVWHNVEVNPIPVANFSYNQPSCSGLTTQFTDHSVAPSGYIVEWMWDFDDGSAPITVRHPNNPNITHTYANSGTYNVSLTVKSSDSCVNAAILDVVITAAPIANFGVSNACFGSLTAFADSSTMVDNINIVAWAWDFGEPVSGNNNRSNVQNAVHQYLTTGTYQVRLIVTNANGCTDTITKPVIIAVPSPLDFDFSSACLNTQIQFTVDTVITNIANVTNWLWDFGDGITSTLRNPTHTYSVSGTYTVSLTALNINGCSNTITHEIIVFIAPIANFNFDNPTCSSDSVQFNDFSNTPFGTNITEWKWIFGDGDTLTVIRPNNPNIQHRYDSVGTFTVTLIITNSNGCESSVSRQITTLPSPIADFTYTPACMNELTQFNDASVPNGGGNVVSWRWNFGDPISTVNNTSTQQNPVHQYNTAGTFTVTLLVENTQGCTDTVSHQVSVTELPEVDFNITEACIGADVQFTIDSIITPIDSIATYFWDFGDGITSNLQNPSHSYLTVGTYTVSLIVTDINGCSNTVSHDLSLAALPQSLFGVSESQCNTDPIQFTNFSTTEEGYITEWHWDFGDGNDSIISFPNNPNLSHLYATNGTYTATLTVTNSNGCSNVSTQEIIILPGPIANFDFESVCLDVSARFTDLSQANGGGIITRWNWDFGDPTSGINNSSTLQNPSHLFKTVGDHVVLLTIYNEKGCMDTITKTINISMLPDIDFTTIGGTCLDGVTQFLIDTILVDLSRIQSVLWNFGDGLSSNLRAPYHTYAVAGTYQITLTIIDLNGCTNTVTKEVYIDQLPDVKFDTDAPNCSGNETRFTDLSSTSNFIVKWHWEFGDGTDTIINWPNEQNVTHIYPSSGSYQAKLTITTSDSCVNTAEKIITIIPAPVANFVATTVCIDHPAQFTDLSQENSGGVIVDRLWDFGDPASGINNNSTRQNPVHLYAVSGTYPVSLTITNAEGCQSIYSDSVVVTLPPALDPFTFTDVICVNTEVEFFMSNNVNLADVQTILWDFGDPTSSDNNSSAQNPTHIYQTAGQYIVTLTLDNDNCGGSISDTIIVHSRPQARFEFTNACIGSPTVFTDLSLYSDSPIEKWKWDFGIINLLSDTSNIQNPVYTYRALGQHYVSLEVTDTVGCSDKLDSVLIEIFPTPTADFTFLESAQGTLSFTNKSLNADTYEWNFGDGWISNETDPIHVYDSTNSMISSTYEDLELMLISMNNVGCADTATKTYDLYFKGLYIPTAFSPNNPSESVRYFKPMGVNLETYKIEVYSTWNQLLWESSALDENGIPTESWDGTFKGSALPSGIYIWKASGVFKDGTIWKGNDLNNTGSGPTSGTLLLIR